MRRVRKILLWILLILAVPIILTGGAGAAFIWLAGEEAWTAAMRAATTAASTPDQQMSVDGFRRDEEGVLRLARFSLADAKGDWLVVEDIAVELHPSHLFDHTIHLEKVTAARVELLRQPAAKRILLFRNPSAFRTASRSRTCRSPCRWSICRLARSSWPKVSRRNGQG